MSDKQELWARQEGESLLWYSRFTTFRLTVPVRSIADVFQQEELAKKRENPRTKPTGDWYEQAKKWKWEERAAAWDAQLDTQIEQQIAAEEKRIIRAHYALKHKRIQELDTIVTRLIGYLEDEHNVWLPDVKGIGTGPTAERVDLIRFNDALFAQIRGYFADIAAEKGDRVKNNKMSISFPPDTYYGIGPDDDGSEVG